VATDLSEYVDSLRREVEPLGSDAFAAVINSQWTSYLSDAFWEAKLDGFFTEWSCDVDGIVDGNTEFPRQGIQLCVIYAGVRVLRNKVLNTSTKFRAKAGDVEYEQESGALMLSEMLKQLKAQKEMLLTRAEETGSTVAVFDALSVRENSMLSYYGGWELT
jgi:hypothetical protein